MNQPPNSSRGVAVSILSDILENGAYANIALRKALSQTNLDSRDRAFVTELVNETLRNLLSIDYVLNHFSKLPVAKMKPFIRNLLRMSVCQLRHMDKTPESAAVNEAVILAKSHGYAGLGGFVNGVLRTVARQPNFPNNLDTMHEAQQSFPKNAEAPPMPGINDPAYLARRYSYPGWLAAKLVEWLGTDEAQHFCQNSHLPPPVTIFTNIGKITTDALAARLLEEGVDCSSVGDNFLMLRNAGDMTQLSTFQEGLFFVMDPGAIWAVAAMQLNPGQTVIDLCAAPGGKSFTAACLMGNTGHVRAFDIHPHRTALIRESIRRLGLTCINPETKDATVHDPNLDATADAVLLDAPCSGFGTIRKRPEIKYNRKASDISLLAEKQRQMLSIGAKYVKPGGILVYSTCTVAREENIDNIRWFLQNHPFEVRPPEIPAHSDMRFIQEDGSLQILPGPVNDGFFIAAMVNINLV